MLRSLSTDDGDVNENGNKAIGLDWHDNKFARASDAFLYISLQSLYDYDVNVSNFTICRGREHETTTTSLFFSWTSIQSFRIQLENNLPTFDELNAME